MNVVKFDLTAFVLPEDMDAFRKRYGVDIIFLDGEDGTMYGIGPNDREWRELPDTGSPEQSIVRPIRKE